MFIQRTVHVITAVIFLMAATFGVQAATQSAPQQEAGQVLMVSGQASAKTGQGDARVLARRTTVYVGDTLSTGNESQVQLRMKDGATIALGANAQFEIKEYSFKKAGDTKDAAVLSLVKGGLRTISGQIEKSGYKMETPVATLGIRGTVFDVYVNPKDGTTTVILREGGVDATGAGKTVKLDIAGLATIIRPGQAPTEPGTPPQDILDYLRAMFPLVEGDITWQQGEDGEIVINIGDDLIINVINDVPPEVNGNGEPKVDIVPFEQCTFCECFSCVL